MPPVSARACIRSSGISSSEKNPMLSVMSDAEAGTSNARKHYALLPIERAPAVIHKNIVS